MLEENNHHIRAIPQIILQHYSSFFIHHAFSDCYSFPYLVNLVMNTRHLKMHCRSFFLKKNMFTTIYPEMEY